MGLLLAFITYIGWGAGDIFSAITSRYIGAYRATAYVFLFGVIVASFYLPFAIQDFYKITPLLFVINFLMGGAYLFACYLSNEAYKRSNASLVGVIVQCFPAVVLVLSALIFRDTITSAQMVWTVIIFAGVFLCTVNLRDFKNSHIFTDVGIRYALVAFYIFAFYFTFLRLFTNAYGWFWPNYISFLSFPFVLLAIRSMFKIEEKIRLPKSKRIIFYLLVCAVLLRGADIALNYGIGNGYAAIVTPIASASPTLFVAISSFVFRDPLSHQQKLGLGVCLLGIVLLSFFP